MISDKKVVVVMPAYNAANTLERTLIEIPRDIVDQVILVDDGSSDKTFELAKSLDITACIRHQHNLGYGGNQKSCYNKALEMDADIIIMLHPDYQYTPKLIASMAYIIANEVYPVVLGSRILGKGAIKGGMPLYKYFSNRMLTLIQNLLINQKLSEYHTGFRAFSAEVLRKINYNANSNGFIFDNQILMQVFDAGYEIGEITCPTRYFPEASSIGLLKSIGYGLGVLSGSFGYVLHQTHIRKNRRFIHK